MSHGAADIYSFFESFKDYKIHEKEMDVKLSRGNHNTECYSFISDDRKFGTETAKDVCLKFKILYNIIEQKRHQKEKDVDDKDFSYLNYWLNCLSRNTTSSNRVTFKEFQTKMDSVEDISITVSLNGKLYEIKNDDFNNMILLSNLHDNHAEIYQKTTNIGKRKISCIEYFEKYISIYKQGIIQCPHDNTSFCKALKHFKEEYENTFLVEHSMTVNCIDRDRLELPTYEDISGNKQITMVGTVLGPSFGTLFTLLFLYKFTPFGQWILAKMKTKKGAHSNLYEENDQSFLNSSDNEHINLDYNQYGISYDSVVNS
ncbi:PIR Superfamily Protein [Plasmodium ovale curtisi]|uniref:PIR Superfamily Protein n=1 Tax=Plasmodium ovale curtisi TaxID=864141 RepID=A0A1A8W8F2_PLAOA|nr:PIR Superfamily Protein [Plasmodium ovale curtisi]